MKKYYLIRLSIALTVGVLSLLALYKIYPIKIMNLQLTPLIGRMAADFSMAAALVLALILIFTIIFGRFYCSTICPYGIMQEAFALLIKRKGAQQKNLPVKYFIAAVAFGALIGGSALLIRYIDPYTIFSSAVSLSLFGLIFTFLVLALVCFKNRYFCSNICPVGAVLGLISKVSKFKININKEKCVSCGMCAKSCPTGCINHKEKTVDNETCIKCLKCLKECKLGAISYSKAPIKFNFKRRQLILSAAVVAVLGGAIKAGSELSKNLYKKIQNIILPPGAKDTNTMANKCLNCNLCINNCPNKILAKANEDFSAVHIDYSLGKGYCEFNCNECSKVCPSGAIKKMPLSEKQKTRIAIASIKLEICSRCGICSFECPNKAISLDEKGQPIIDGAKCIGCNKCAKKCPSNAIEIFSVNEQKTI